MLLQLLRKLESKHRMLTQRQAKLSSKYVQTMLQAKFRLQQTELRSANQEERLQK